MRRPWRAKAILQGLFSVVPGGDRLNYVFQRHVTHGYPVSDVALAADRASSEHHLSATERHVGRALGELRFFEFGAGWDLAVPLLLASKGARHQLVLDLRPLARVDLAADIARRIGLIQSSRNPGQLSDLLAPLGIEYRAPSDARATGEMAGSVDVITSTNTLEHIPPSDIALILRECRRILAPDGIMSFEIDYKDHYSYFDRSLGTFAYLRYTERHWRLYNPSLHHQNRLRHRDYLELFDDAGFEVLEEYLTVPTDEDLAAIAALPPSRDFASYSNEELGIRQSHVVLRACTKP